MVGWSASNYVKLSWKYLISGANFYLFMICFPQCNCFCKKNTPFSCQPSNLVSVSFQDWTCFMTSTSFQQCWGTVPSVFLTTVDSLVETMSVISACSRIKYCIIDNPDIKTWHGPPLSAVTKRSNIYIFLLSSPQSPASEGNTECLQAIWDRKETAVNSVLWRRTVNHLLIRTLCGLVTGNCPLTAGFTGGEIWCLVESQSSSDISQPAAATINNQ